MSGISSTLQQTLHYACLTGNAAAVRAKFVGIKPAALNKKLTEYEHYLDGTPLHIASRIGNLEIVELLVAAGADLAIRDVALEPALAIALRAGHEAVARQLVAAGADVQQKCRGGRVPLHYAAINCGRETIELLLKQGADVNSLDSQKSSALDYTSNGLHEYNLPGAKALLDNGINAALITPAFRWACWRDNPELAQLLLDHGADLARETTPTSELLFWICSLGYHRTVQLLLNYGVDFTRPVKFRGRMNSYHGSPLDEARKRGHQAVSALIESAATKGTG